MILTLCPPASPQPCLQKKLPMTRSTAGTKLRRGLLLMLLLPCAALTACNAPARGTSVATTSVTSSAAPTASSTTKPTPSAALAKPKISKAGFTYFLTIALGSEYGDKVSVVKMWSKPEVTVRIHGNAGNSKGCLSGVIRDFNAITETTDLKLTKEAADIEFYFAPLSKFRSIEPNYVPGNDGYFYVRWSNSSVITSAIVLVRSSGIGERIRCHLIREELTQAMGLMRDSSKYPGSIFYGKYRPAPTKYSALDKEVIRMLYSGAVQPGDGRAALKRAVTVV
jgi:Protein of unknown function (DUF2927)